MTVDVAAEARDAVESGRPRAAVEVWRDVLVVWAASRALFLVTGAVGHAFEKQADFVGTYRPPSGFLSYWASWDGGWFSHIAQHGYDTPAATAFFPLFPIVVRVVTEVGSGPALAGVGVSLAAALAALFFVYRLAEHWFDACTGRAAMIALAFFPTSLFLGAVYSESLFLALTAGALWALYVRRDLLVAGAFGYLAAVTRNVGVLLVVPFAAEWIRRRRDVRRETLLGVACPVLGLTAYCLYLWKAADKPLLFAEAQKSTWGRQMTDPLVTIARGWHQADDGLPYLVHPQRVFGTASANPPFAVSATLNFVFLAAVAVLLVVAARRLPPPVTAYCALVAAAPLLYPGPQVALTSYPRYALAPLPLFVVLGRLLARSRLLLAAWVCVGAAVGAFMTVEFVTLRWVA